MVTIVISKTVDGSKDVGIEDENQQRQYGDSGDSWDSQGMGYVAISSFWEWPCTHWRGWQTIPNKGWTTHRTFFVHIVSRCQ